MTSPWTEFLVGEGAVIEDHTVTFPNESAGATKTIAVPLLDLGLIRSSGDDSAAFLHNLCSNDVKKLAAGDVQWNSFNSPKGRMLASFLLWPQDDGHCLAVSADLHPAFLKKLSMYVLRSKVRLSDAGAELALVGLSGANARELIERANLPCPDAPMKQAIRDGSRTLRLTSEAFIVAVPVAQAGTTFRALLDAGAQRAGTSAWQLAMIRAGLPMITVATQEEFVAQMVNFDLIGGVSFTKGCYPGQEIVARTRYLGKLKKRMYRVSARDTALPKAGTDLYTPGFGDQSAGKIVNAAPTPDGGFEALAVLQISCAQTGPAFLGAPDGPQLELLDLPYELSDAEAEHS
ncbi:MAG: folate-binding protein YgfZ [Rhodocyclaceae bacterium]|jgi:folate-binding protein YgfZ|nr:folate-binding protein YgfZ [Rhodocyclaceae bacterium]